MNYEETQYGWFVIILFLMTIVSMFLLYIEQWGTHPIPKTPFLVMEGLFIFLLAMFYRMVIRIEEGVIKIIYGIGLIRIKIKPESDLSVEVFKVPWYWGMGIRMTPKGWLYSLNSLRSVLIKFNKKGKKKSVLIGTPDPEQLKTALEHHFYSIAEGNIS